MLDKSKKHYEIPTPTGSLRKEDAENEIGIVETYFEVLTEA